MFQTIRQVSNTLNVPEHLIRCMVAQGTCPGVYSGNRFLVHVEALREYLATKISRSVNLDKAFFNAS